MKSRKFELIEEYPGSPELGSIHIPNGFGVIAPQVTVENVDNYTQHWREMFEEFEVQSFSYKKWESLAKIKDDGLYYTKSGSFWTYNSLIGCGISVKSGHIKIHSIKRLSDGEVFTIGDSVMRYGKIAEIRTIKLDKNWAGGAVINEGLKPYLGECIETLSKVDNPILKTEEGVEIFEGDELWWLRVIEDDNEIEEIFSYGKYGWNGEISINGTYKWFSNEYSAKEYIIMNKPLLSVMDVKQQLPKLIKAGVQKFINLAEERI